MKNNLPIVTPVPDRSSPVDGQDYYFVRGNMKDMNSPLTIHKGTCARCDKCQRIHVSNAVMITSFGNTEELKVTVNMKMTNAEELAGYHEESGEVLCQKCHPEA